MEKMPDLCICQANVLASISLKIDHNDLIGIYFFG